MFSARFICIYFNPRSPQGERHRNLLLILMSIYFNPRSPQGERPSYGLLSSYRLLISIHAPRRGSDPADGAIKTIPRISIHAPRRGSDLFRHTEDHQHADFNPRSPQGERHKSIIIPLFCTSISIHAPRRGSDLRQAFQIQKLYISIHAPRRGSDAQLLKVTLPIVYFNPRSPQGERHAEKYDILKAQRFQSTLPAGGATVQSKHTAMTA